MIGIAVELFMHHTSVPPEVRLFIITGFLGSLTTFSTFSAEAVTLLSRQQHAWFAALVTFHLAGSLMMTLAGMFTVKWIYS